MIRGVLLLALLLCACGEPRGTVVVVSVTGLDGEVTSLRAGLTLNGDPSEPLEVRRGLSRFGLRLPEQATGDLSLQIDALLADRCVAARGFARLPLTLEPPPEVQVALSPLPQRLCLCSATGWCWENPLPQGNSLTDVFSLSATDVWAVGGAGTVFHYDGARWHSVQSGTISNLYSIWGTAPDDLWAVGERATVLHWDGQAFTAVNVPEMYDLLAVWAVPGEALAVGDKGLVVRIRGGGSAVTIENLGQKTRLRAIWGAAQDDIWVGGDDGLLRHYTGAQWEVPAGMATTRDILGLWGTSGKDLWAVGEAGTILHVIDGRVQAEASGTLVDLTSIWGYSPGTPFSDEGEMWVVGGGTGTGSGLVLRRQMGKWVVVPVTSQDSLNALSGVDGSGPGDVWAVGAFGTILHWQNDEDRPAGTRNTARTIHAVWGSGPTDVWAVGGYDDRPDRGAAILHYDGKIWTTDASMDRRVGLLTGVSGGGPADVWAVGRAGVVLHYSGGPGWLIENTAGLGTADLRGVHATPAGEVWAVGDAGTVLHRVGGRWSRASAEARYNLSCVWGARTDAGEQRVWIGGGDAEGRGVILRWQDGRLVPVLLGTIARVQDLAGSGPDDVWAVIDKNPMLRFDGRTWTPVDTGTNRAVSALWFAGPRDGWAVGEEGRILYWNGTGWARLISGTTNDLYGIWGDSPWNRWAVGRGGTILRRRL